MYNYIMSLFDNKKSHPFSSHPFSKDFRKGYKNAWISNISNYKP